MEREIFLIILIGKIDGARRALFFDDEKQADSSLNSNLNNDFYVRKTSVKIPLE